MSLIYAVKFVALVSIAQFCHPSEISNKQRVEMIKKEILGALGMEAPPNLTNLQRNETEKDMKSYILNMQSAKRRVCPQAHCTDIVFSDANDDGVILQNDDVIYVMMEIRKNHNKHALLEIEGAAPVQITKRTQWTNVYLSVPAEQRRQNNVVIKTKCINCRVVTKKTRRMPPMIVVKRRVISRSRRQTVVEECSGGCCRKSQEVSFYEFGWGDWILAPSGFKVSHCVGSCTNAEKPYYRSFLSSKAQACCVPKNVRSLEILHQQNVGPQQELRPYKKTLKDMKVESCWCA